MDFKLKDVRLLIAMNHRQVAETFRDALRQEGVGTAVIAMNFRQAAQQLRQQGITMLLIEENFANDTGMEFVRQLRYSRKTQAMMPIIMAVEKTSERLIKDVVNAGINTILPAPFTAQKVKTMVRNLWLNLPPFIDTPNYFGPCRRGSQRGAEYDSRRAQQVGLISASDVKRDLVKLARKKMALAS